MKPYSLLLSLLLVLLCSSCHTANTTAQQTADKDDYTPAIDSLLQTTAPYRFNGVILIAKQGLVKYARAYGYANLDTKKPLTLDDNFEIMSNSKQFTAVLLLQQVEKGTVDLQAPISTYLPALKQAWADSVTVHQLLNHTHGITDLDKPLAFLPGTDYQYGNLASILLGKIIEATARQSYTELATALFKQYNMQHTYCYQKGKQHTLVFGHRLQQEAYQVVNETFINTENLPADGIITTAGDLMIWNEQLHNGKILQPETYQQMTTPSARSQHNAFGTEKMGYGYNIRIAAQNGITYLGHTGLGDGFASINIYIPASGVSIIVLENQMPDNSEQYYYFETKIKDIILHSTLLQ